jgi:transposase
LIGCVGCGVDFPRPQEELIALVAAQAAEIAALKARLAELERRVGLNSSNSGKPPIEQALGRPSSDGLNKPPRAARTKSLRGPVTLGMFLQKIG